MSQMKMPAGQLRSGNTAVEGKWKVPYLAEENADEDPEIQFLTSSESDATCKAKAVLHSLGKKASSLFASVAFILSQKACQAVYLATPSAMT